MQASEMLALSRRLMATLLPLMLCTLCLSGCASMDSSRDPAFDRMPPRQSQPLSSGSLPVPGADLSGPRRCQEITVPMCRGIGYNYTSMPNQFNHETQEEAGLEVHQFWPLVEISCSEDLRFFLCSMYVPICMHNYDRHLPACRSVCERAKRGCAPLMRQYGFSWPDRMDCSRLPEFGDPDILCMDVNHTKSRGNAAAPNGRQQHPLMSTPPAQRHPQQQPPEPPECDCSCRAPLITLTELEHPGHYNRVHTAGLPNCALPCDGGAYFGDRGDRDRQFATVWTGMWSILCAISSTLTVLTFLMDRRRFSYPERPIVMMSACYVMVSAGYIVRLAVGTDGIACDGRILRYGSSGPWLCTLVFLLTYLFGMASCVWWLVLCVAWFMAAVLKWGSEAIAKYSEVFHCVAWFLPIAKFILVLTFSLVDGDPVSGICSVGNTNLTAMRLFVLAPLVTYLLLGSIFLLTGFVALFRIRSVMKQQACAKTYKLEKLMIRIGIFSILYTLPACVVIACHFYEAQMRETWLHAKTCRCTPSQPDQQPPEPEYAVFMLRQFMQLAVGITSGVWVWSRKTLETWRLCFIRLCCCFRAYGDVGRETGQQRSCNNVAAGNGNFMANLVAADPRVVQQQQLLLLQQQQQQQYNKYCLTASSTGFPPQPQPPLPSLPSLSQLSHV